MEGLDAAIVVGGPAPVLVAADFAFEPMHRSGCQLLVYSCWLKRERKDKKKRRITQRRREHRGAQRVGASCVPFVVAVSEAAIEMPRFAQDDTAKGAFGAGTVRHRAREEGRWIETVG
jgi:hypothetical protein